MNKLDLAGRVAVVTGGVSGIGLAIAQRMADSGAAVSLWDRDTAALEKTAKELGAKTKLHTAVVDVANYSEVSAAAKSTAAHFGKIDDERTRASRRSRIARSEPTLTRSPICRWAKARRAKASSGSR